MFSLWWALTRVKPLLVVRRLRMSGARRGITIEADNGAKRKKSDPWSEADVRECELLLQQTCQVWEIARRLGKTKEQVRRRMNEHESLKSLLKPLKVGHWSSTEVDRLMELYGSGKSPAQIAYLTRTAKQRVCSKILRMLSQTLDAANSSGLRNLQPPPAAIDEQIVSLRLLSLFEDLLLLPMTSNWRAILSRRSSQEWLNDIAANIPFEVKQLLMSPQRPSLAQLATLSWVETSDAGVYGRILVPKRRQYVEDDCYVYVGSASKHGYGLKGRKAQHLSNGSRARNTRLRRLIKDKILEPSRFVTLMTKSFAGDQADEVMEVRHLVVLAEALFTLWLDPSRDSNSSSLQSLPLVTSSYHKATSHNPLTKDVVPAVGYSVPQSGADLVTWHKPDPPPDRDFIYDEPHKGGMIGELSSDLDKKRQLGSAPSAALVLGPAREDGNLHFIIFAAPHV